MLVLQTLFTHWDVGEARGLFFKHNAILRSSFNVKKELFVASDFSDLRLEVGISLMSDYPWEGEEEENIFYTPISVMSLKVTYNGILFPQ